jgi:hypothetical protein
MLILQWIAAALVSVGVLLLALNRLHKLGWILVLIGNAGLLVWGSLSHNGGVVIMGSVLTACAILGLIKHKGMKS